MSNKPDNAASTRREFLRNAAVTAAASVAASGVAKSNVYSLAPGRVIGANDRISIGHIGVGVQGYGAHVRLLKDHEKDNNTQQIAVCDLAGWRQNNTARHLGLSESQKYWDYRKLLENKDIDAVVVATSDNWHAPICIAAMEAGKHVYCEKPMCKTLEEVFALHDAVKKTKRTFQLGSQGSSDPKYKNIAEIVRSGKIGHLIMGQDSYNRGDNRIGEWNNYGENPFKAPYNQASPTASGEWRVDWETFRKGTEPKQWDPDRFFRWRKYWEYGSGLCGDLYPHRLHPLHISMDLPITGNEGWPLRVASGGGLYVQKVNPDTGKPDREVPDFTYITVDFGQSSLIAMSTTISEQGMRPMLRGNKATIFYSGNTAQVTPERSWSDEVEAANVPLNGNGEPIEVHEKNWLDCIRSGKDPNCNIDLAARVQTIITLAELSYRNNQTFTFDPATRKASPDPHKFAPA